MTGKLSILLNSFNSCTKYFGPTCSQHIEFKLPVFCLRYKNQGIVFPNTTFLVILRLKIWKLGSDSLLLSSTTSKNMYSILIVYYNNFICAKYWQDKRQKVLIVFMYNSSSQACCNTLPNIQTYRHTFSTMFHLNLFYALIFIYCFCFHSILSGTLRLSSFLTSNSHCCLMCWWTLTICYQ